MLSASGAPPTGSPSVAVVTLPGEIDAANHESVITDLANALASGAATVIADATGTTFMDTSGVRALVLSHKAAAAKNAQLRIATSSHMVLRTLSILKLDSYLSIYPTVAQAQAAGDAATRPTPQA